MKLAQCYSHERGKAVIQEKGLEQICTEVRGTLEAARLHLEPCKAREMLRPIRERVLSELAGLRWEIGARIFPVSAPVTFHRGQYRLDAVKRAAAGARLGLIFHVGSSEFIVRQLMLTLEAVRLGVVDACVLALMTRDVKPYITGRPAYYEQAKRLLREYGQSGFRGVPMVLWGLRPEAIRPEQAHLNTGLRVGVR